MLLKAEQARQQQEREQHLAQIEKERAEADARKLLEN